VASYAYDAANRRTQLTLPNGVAIDYAYDAASRLTSLTYSGLQGGPQTLTYAYDPAGNRVRTGGSWARTLLPTAVSGGTYDAANRQLTLGGKTMTYDLNGNLATLTESGQTTTYNWDARNRLTSLSGPGLSASFTYDAKNRRTSKTIAGFSSTFLYDDVDITKESDGGATVNYLRGLGIDEHLARIEDSSNTMCYAPDPLGSTVALTDGTADVATEYTYEPFGLTRATGAASQNALQFTGRENDGTGHYYYRARYYFPATSRFTREDPIGVWGGVNSYSYVGNSPLTFADPTGHIGMIPAFAGAGAGAGTVVAPGPGTLIGAGVGAAIGLAATVCILLALSGDTPQGDCKRASRWQLAQAGIENEHAFNLNPA
jgi:RHS repeat-associated protein